MNLFILLFFISVFGNAQTYFPVVPYSHFLISWTGPDTITENNDWNFLPFIKGFKGDGLTALPDVDPKTVLTPGTGTQADLLANQTNPDGLNTDGFAEFQGLSNPTLGMRASSNSNPFLMFNFNTTGVGNNFYPYLEFEIRDIDGSANNAIQQIAVQYRIGDTGNFTNGDLFFFQSGDFVRFEGYLPDATTGPYEANHSAVGAFNFPLECLFQPKVQIRIITTNASGGNEWIGIDEIFFNGIVLLPITCSDFYAEKKQNQVLVTWKATCNSSQSSFAVERSADAVHFTSINSQQPKGNGEFAYTFSDKNPLRGESFYRLKMIDKDGKFTYSEVRRIKSNSETFYINNVFPCPASDFININIHSADNIPSAFFQIVSMEGKLVLKQKSPVNKGNSNLSLPVGNLMKGSYYLIIDTGKERFTISFIKI